MEPKSSYATGAATGLLIFKRHRGVSRTSAPNPVHKVEAGPTGTKRNKITIIQFLKQKYFDKLQSSPATGKRYDDNDGARTK